MSHPTSQNVVFICNFTPCHSTPLSLAQVQFEAHVGAAESVGQLCSLVIEFFTFRGHDEGVQPMLCLSREVRFLLLKSCSGKCNETFYFIVLL